MNIYHFGAFALRHTRVTAIYMTRVLASNALTDIANIINNTDLDKISQSIANSKKDKQTLRKPIKLQGEWNLDPSKGFQFRTELSYEKGKEVIEIDSPPFLGGNGNRLGPMAYCVAGITSFFIATFTSVGAQRVLLSYGFIG